MHRRLLAARVLVIVPHHAAGHREIPAALFALIIGVNRWIYRVIAYAALMTDQYPPFRLDQGGTTRTEAADAPCDTDRRTPA